MKITRFDYELPPELIARRPAGARVKARLLRLDRKSGRISHHRVYQLPELLKKDDLLVLNDSRVIPARLMGKRVPGGGRTEILLLKQKEPLLWEVMARPGKKIREGDRIVFEAKLLEGVIKKRIGRGERLMRFECRGDWDEVLARYGHTPLPPYILKARRDDLHTDMAHTPLEEPGDRERYQTVYAKNNGSVAAPTAGLHFTPRLLDELRAKGVETRFVTLHVGAGTFLPVKVENVEDHPMHSEFFVLSAESADAINCARDEGRRVVAVGTTAVRVLESCAGENGRVRAQSGETELMIAPGYRFKCVDALLTNFHLPQSTLLMLVCAFAGRGPVLSAYREAIRENYRFYSYGDAMLLE